MQVMETVVNGKPLVTGDYKMNNLMGKPTLYIRRLCHTTFYEDTGSLEKISSYDLRSSKLKKKKILRSKLNK